MQVIVRDAKTFVIHYPHQNLRFQLKVGQHKKQAVWILRDANNLQDVSAKKQLDSEFKTSLFNSKGDGWKGLGSGVVAELDKIGNLLLELDRGLTGSLSKSTSKYHHLDAQIDGSGDSMKTRANEQAGSEGSGNESFKRDIPAPTTSNIQGPVETAATSGSRETDIIMID